MKLAQYPTMFSMRYQCAIASGLGLMAVFIIGVIIYLVSEPSTKHVSTVVVDSDGGVDDVMALLMLLRTINVKVMAVTTVQGNTGVRNATRNIRTLLHMLHQDHGVAVYPGRDKREVEEGYYGWDGLGDFLLPAPPLKFDRPNPGEILAKIVSNNPGKVIVLCLGPLTNLASALTYQPELLNMAKQVIIVGASYKGGGNVGPGLEFNMATDPDAASAVFNKASQMNPIQLIPLETIDSYASFPRAWREEIGQNHNLMMDFFNKAENKSLDKDEQWTCYDQTGAALIISPDILLSTRHGRLSIDNKGVTQFTPTTHENSSFRVVTSLSKEHLKILIKDALLTK